MNKEQIYDEKISPLIEEISAVCKKHGIAMIASFSIPTDKDENLACTSCLPDESGNNGRGHINALRAIGAPV